MFEVKFRVDFQSEKKKVQGYVKLKAKKKTRAKAQQSDVT